MSFFFFEWGLIITIKQDNLKYSSWDRLALGEGIGNEGPGGWEKLVGAVLCRWAGIRTRLWSLTGQTCSQVLGLSLPSCVIIDKMLTLSEP